MDPNEVVREIKIQIDAEGCLDVVEGDLSTGKLCFDEMLGHIAAMTMPEKMKRTGIRYEMKTAKGWEEYEKRIRSFAAKT